MVQRTIRQFATALFFLCLAMSGVNAADGKRIMSLDDNGDYFGFDIRTETGGTLEACEKLCLNDSSCRAITFNKASNWCFLKSDFGKLQPTDKSIAGRVVELGSEPDLGAAPELDLPSRILDDAGRYRREIIADAPSVGEVGSSALNKAAFDAADNADAHASFFRFSQAVAVSPDISALWAGLAKSAAVVAGSSTPGEARQFQRAALAGSLNSYRVSRSAKDRAEALALVADNLLAQNEGTASLSIFKASLDLIESKALRLQLDAAREKYGFRVLGNTVDADAQTPRACVQFSESLTDEDYSSYVLLDSVSAPALTVDGQEICVDGLKHGGRYSLTLRSGLPSATGDGLVKSVSLNLFVRDREAVLRFTGDNFVLPASGRLGIPLISVNAERASLQLFRVGDRGLTRLFGDYSQFLSQLDAYSIADIRDNIGAPVWSGVIDISSRLNEDVTTSFPVDEALPERQPGVYVLTAAMDGKPGDDWEARATQWFVVSDLGLSTFAGEDGLSVFVRSLGTAQPVADAQLTLVARNNEILGEATTDASGMARFSAGMTRGTNGLVPATLTARTSTGDYVFLDMTRAGFDLSDRGVTGRPAAGPLDVYAWTERGIYRAGETVHAQALARDGAADAVVGLPLVFAFIRPDGVEDRQIVSSGADAGGHSIDYSLQDNAQRGAWRVKIFADIKQEPLAEKVFLVEDFVPDRAEFTLTGGTITLDEPTEITVDGRFLYGAPAAGLTLEGETVIKSTQSIAAFPGYVFGLSDEAADNQEVRTPLENLPVLDSDGKAIFDLTVSDAPDTTRPLTGTVTVRMRENGGRAVERTLNLEVESDAIMLGIKPHFDDGQVHQGGVAGFSIIAIDPDASPVDLPGLTWSLVKVDRNYQWYRNGSGWRYETVEFTTRIAGGSIDVSAASASEISAPVDWGKYRLEVTAPDEVGAVSSVDFHAGYYVDAASTETPDGLEIGLGKAIYNVGDVAKLQVSPQFAGELLVTIGAERLLQTIHASVPEGGTTIDIPVDRSWGAGVYVTATLFRPSDSEASRLPMRAIGVKWLAIDPGARRLSVAIDSPETIRPNTRLDVPVKIAGAIAGEEVYVTLAAVDIGILNLTGHEPPAPDDWYFGQRRLGLEVRDLYGRLIDGSSGVFGRIRTGGDGPVAAVSKGSPPTEALLALYSGVLRVGDDGVAMASFEIPQFNGTARLMAVAWSMSAVGHASRDMIIRDPVVVVASLPRFLSQGDTADLLVEVANVDGPAGEYSLTITTTPELLTDATPTVFSLEQGERLTHRVPLGALEIGSGKITIALAQGEALRLVSSRVVPVRAQSLPVTSLIKVPLAANGGKVTVDKEMLTASILRGASVTVSVSSHAAFDVPALLMTLDRYPYGCAEQTTSRALPLLYVSQLAQRAGLDPSPELGERVQAAIDRVLTYQAASGGFGLWGPGSGDLWLDAYVSDFLTRARELNYRVPETAMLLALENLQNTLAYQNDVEARGTELAYALYVLARNRRASLTDLRYYAESRIADFTSPMARAQLAAGLGLYGDAAGSERVFQSAFTLAKATGNKSESRGDYGSPLRDSAAMLALAAETSPAVGTVQDMVAYVSELREETKWTSTQDQAWLLLAARALAEEDAAIALDVNGVAHAGALSRRVEGAQLLSEPIAVTNSGAQPVDAMITVVASPTQAPVAGGDGFAIDRRYFRLDGSRASVTDVKQNDRFVTVLTVDEQHDWPSRVLVTDLLPAGFEIDNPKLVGSAELPNFSWLKNIEAAHVEYRDDRFVAAFDRTGNEPRRFTLAYVVRAVTPGNYVHPAASVEDMYRPQYSARTASANMNVTLN
jgi:uncharacterized protein YfaS (alpha-2-macroglobulin family)